MSEYIGIYVICVFVYAGKLFRFEFLNSKLAMNKMYQSKAFRIFFSLRFNTSNQASKLLILNKIKHQSEFLSNIFFFSIFNVIIVLCNSIARILV
jgi:hypothetical protein